MVQSNMVRPLPSTISSTSSISHQLDKRRLRGRGTTTWLWSLCIFLFVLASFLLTALILIGKKGARESSHHHLALHNYNYTVLSNQLSNESQNKSVIVLINQFGNRSGDHDQVNGSSGSGVDTMAQRFAHQLSFRLQKEIKPLLYKLDLFPDLITKKFNGTVEIDLDVLNPVPYIAIHSKTLDITNTSVLAVQGAQSSNVPITTTYPFEKFEYWVTEFETPIEAGRYKLSLNFHGSLTDRIIGFYASSYYSPTRNATRTIATSKFEPTYARQAFPCFDEPGKKAEFEISVVRPTGDDYIALSNMNELSSVELEEGSGLTRTTFNKSVPMSTYLACFIVCDFEKKAAVIESNGIGQNVELRVYATPHQLNKVDLALDAAKIITEHYIKYFDIAYPLPKLDLIAIPDFVSGAMEHWGLVTFRETQLLYEKGVSSSANKQRVVTVIAHELAHQWFGNLVTMEFWNDLWLNEGFASYIEYMGTEAVLPDWGMREQFLMLDLNRVVSIDASLATHPIVQNVSSPDQITEIFDAITYSKGATVIRMLEDIIGPENFRRAVTTYLNKHKYGNAITDDLLTEIENLDLGMDIKVIMDTWTRQGGLPVVNVERSADGGQYTLTQKRFFTNPVNENAELPPSDFNYRWYIPVTYFTDANATVSRTWFPHTDTQLKVDVSEEHKWIKFNKDQMGYFLVNYSPEMWSALTSALKENSAEFSVSDRVQLLNDAFLLAEATQLPYNVPLDLSRYLVKETEYVPWSVGISNVLSIRKMVYGTPAVELLRDYALKMIDRIYQDLGWEVKEDEHMKNLLRADVLSFAARFGHAECLDRAKEEFLKWLKNPSVRPHPDIRSVIYNYGMEVAGNETTWKQVWDLFRDELDAQEKVKLMSSLARVQDPSILSRFISLAWDEKNVRRQDYFSCISAIANNRVGEPLVWDYVRMQWPELVARFGLNERYLGSMIPSITDRFSTEMRLQEMKEFFKKYPDAGAGERSRVTALETVQKNIKWLNSNLEPLSDWLSSN